MKRRDFISGVGAGAVATGLAACSAETQPSTASDAAPQQTYNWKMVTTWPPNFPALGTGANELAQNIEAMSNGQIKIKVYGSGELVPAFEAFDAVSRGTADIGHAASYYWKGKNPAIQLFCTSPFGMNAQEMNAWLYFGGGMELWREIYAPFNLIPFPLGNTGTQMGGWFNKEINSVADLKGLKMRIPGFGGEVLQRAGGTPVNIPGGEIFNALQLGQIDACEWIGAYNDRAFGFHKAAKYYYSPGWHEPSATLEGFFNQDSFNALPPHLQAIVQQACQASNVKMLAEFTARNMESMETLVNEDGVQLRTFPVEVMDYLREKTQEVMQDLVAGNKDFAKVYKSYKSFQDRVSAYHKISEEQLYRLR
ncbi:MAG: TRAP transporter substrate-binding protein DctP [Gammaproteobacteria bacterium]|nr:TRAP transporter substrate-binding protein DctP [Gammaproteobacteria bacterium]